VVVVAIAAGGNIDTSYRGTVTFTSTDSAAALPGSYTFKAGDAGMHTFTNLVVLKTPGTESVTATDIAVATTTGTQSGITVDAPIPASLKVSGIATPAAAGATSSVTVTVYDSCGSIAADYTGTVGFSSSDPTVSPGAGLPAAYTFTGSAGDAGVHTFSGADGVTLSVAATQSVTAADSLDSSIIGTQSPIVVNPGPCVELEVSGIPSPISDCTGADVTVAALDAFGNTDTAYTGTVAFSSTDLTATLPSVYTFTGAGADNGVHKFAGQVVLKAQGAQTVTVSDGTNSGTQAGILVNAGTATSLLVSGITTPTGAGAQDSVTVTAFDACGGIAKNYTGTVAFSSTDTNATLPANYHFIAADNGTRTFTNGLTFRTVGSQTVTATDTGNASVTGKQTNIQVRAGAATLLRVTGILTQLAPNTLSTVVVTAMDAFGEVATGYTGTIGFDSPDAAATLPANYTFQVSDNGVHTFTNCVVLKTVNPSA